MALRIIAFSLEERSEMCFIDVDSPTANGNPIKSSPRTQKEIKNEVEPSPTKRNLSQTTEILSLQKTRHK